MMATPVFQLFKPVPWTASFDRLYPVSTPKVCSTFYSSFKIDHDSAFFLNFLHDSDFLNYTEPPNLSLEFLQHMIFCLVSLLLPLFSTQKWKIVLECNPVTLLLCPEFNISQSLYSNVLIRSFGGTGLCRLSSLMGCFLPQLFSAMETSSHSSNIPGTLPVHHLVICCSFCLECSSSRPVRMANSLTFFKLCSEFLPKGDNLATQFKISTRFFQYLAYLGFFILFSAFCCPKHISFSNTL